MECIFVNQPVNFKKISEHETPELSPGFLLWKTSILWRRTIEDVLQQFGLTHPQFVILATTGWLTKDKQNVSQKDIGDMAGIDPNTTSQIIRGLEKNGLIKREYAIDERCKYPSLTTKGKSVLTKALPEVEKKDAEFFSVLNLKSSKIVQDLKVLSLQDM